jgi:sugar phosphate isomerase/epimerase
LNLSRRDLLVALPAIALAAGSPDPTLQFPLKPRDRLAVTSWPFRTYIKSPSNPQKAGGLAMDLKQFPAFVTEKFGVYNINPLSSHFAGTDEGYLVALRQAVQAAGSHIVDLGLSGRYFYDPDPATRQSAIDYGRKWIDIAVKVGSPSVRQHLQARSGQKPDPTIAAEAFQQLADYGVKRNIVVNLENDNPMAEDPFVLVAIIERVNSPYLRALPDFGNALMAHDESYNERGVRAMLGHAWNMCHVKDFVQSDDGHVTQVNLARMFELAKQSSYRGYYSMEFDTDVGDPIVGTQKLIEETLQCLA